MSSLEQGMPSQSLDYPNPVSPLHSAPATDQMAASSEGTGVEHAADLDIERPDQHSRALDSNADTVDPVLVESNSQPTNALDSAFLAADRPQIKQALSSTSSLASNLAATRIFGIVLVDFDHTLGPRVEWSYPSHLADDADLCLMLPFLALPDGAHARDEDYSYFHLLCSAISSSTIFGISCNRQIASSQLINRTALVTRSTVQKAIVVLASKPVFGPIRDKLGVITRAFFAQKDFEQTSILVEFHGSLETGLSASVSSSADGDVEDGALYMGTSIRELINKFRFKTLTLLKLLLLQRKIMFYGQQVERLCTFQYSLVSLIPNLLLHLEDAASPSLDSLSKRLTKPNDFKSSDRGSLLRYIGLPLDIFGKNAFFQPYLPLQQIDSIEHEEVSYLVGTTNSIFQQQKDCKIDVIVNIDTASIDFLDPKLAALVHLTAPDRKWMDEVVSTVSDSWNAADPTRPTGMRFLGSDDYLRAKFEEYICSTLSAIKFVDYIGRGKNNSVLLSSSDIHSGLFSYNEAWVAAFKQTSAYVVWDKSTDETIFDLVEPRHPCEGATNVVADVGIRLAQGLHGLHLDENLAPAREAIEKGLQTGTQSVWSFYSSVRNDISKRHLEYKERREQEVEAATTAHSTSESAVSGAPAHVLAGVSEASVKAANLASSVGSFFASKRNQLFTSPQQVVMSTPAAATVPETKYDTETSPDGFPPSVQSPTSASTISSLSNFFRPSPTSYAPVSSRGSLSAPSASSPPAQPSIFRKVSSVLQSGSGADATKSPALKEFALSSSPGQSALRSPRNSPSLSPRANPESRPSSFGSNASRRSSEAQPTSRRSSFQVIEADDAT